MNVHHRDSSLSLLRHQLPAISIPTPMLRSRIAISLVSRCRQFSTGPVLRPVLMLPNASLDGFREKAFNPALPALLPRQFFAELPAIGKWFMRRKIGDAMALNTDYLADYGDTVVPLEITLNDQFVRVEQELSFFLE